MKLPIKNIFISIVTTLLFLTISQSVYADAPGYRGRVVTSTGAPIVGVWVKQTDNSYSSELPDGQYRFAKTDNQGRFEFVSWHTKDENYARQQARTAIDIDLNGSNDSYLAYYRNPTVDVEWWMAFGCGESPSKFELVIPQGWNGNASQITGVTVNNSDGGWLDIGNITYSGTLPIYQVSGNVFVDENRNGVKDGGENNYQGAAISLTGAVSRNTTSAANGGYSFASLSPGVYTASISPPTGYQTTTTASRVVTLGPDQTVNFGIVQNFTINGNVFNDINANGVKDAGEGNYQGATITRTGASSGNAQSDASGNYTFANLNAGTYTIAITTPAGYIVTTTATQSTTVGPNRTFNFGVSRLYTVTGNIYVDTNGNSLRDTGEINYTGQPTITSSRGNVVSAAGGTYTINNLTAGLVTISYTSLPTGYYISYIRNGPPPTFQVTVGPACSTNGAQGAVCAQNITNLNYGINNSLPWIQAVCGNFRNDAGVRNAIPLGQSALITNASCTNPGVAFTGNGSATFAPGTASTTNQIVGGTTYPEVYTPQNSGGIFSSYTYLNAKSQITDTAPVNLATLCTISNCTLPNNLPSGVYHANGNVNLNPVTFPANQDYVFLVNGNLTIRGNIITPNTATSVFSTSGNIIVPATVGSPSTVTTANLSGIFSADRSIILQSNNNCTDLRLNVEGTMIVNAARTGGTLQNDRDLCANNAVSPALQITQRLDFVLNLPDFVRIQQTTLDEVAP